MNRRLSVDQRYDEPRGLTDYARLPAVKWIGLLVAWVIASGVLSITHLGVLLVLSTAGLICYCVYCILRDTPPAGQQTAGQWASEQDTDWHHRQQDTDWHHRQQDTDRHRRQQDTDRHRRHQFNAPPGWPEPPLGWEPPPGWEPDRSWPPAPPGWEFWVWPDERAGFQRMGRNGHMGRSYRSGT